MKIIYAIFAGLMINAQAGKTKSGPTAREAMNRRLAWILSRQTITLEKNHPDSGLSLQTFGYEVIIKTSLTKPFDNQRIGDR